MLLILIDLGSTSYRVIPKRKCYGASRYTEGSNSILGQKITM